MSDSLPLATVASMPNSATVKLCAYLEMSKPRILGMVLAATAVGYYLALPDWNASAWGPLMIALVGTALTALGANALNQVLEIDLDSRMERTANRPLPSGRLTAQEACIFGLAAAGSGVALLAVFVNVLAAAFAAITFLTYAFVYTPLKTRTPLCVLAGAIPGALPPVIGWAAATGSISVGAVLLFGIIFFWQFPHVAAIAWQYREDYARAGCRMLPSLDADGFRIRMHVITNTVGLIAASVLPAMSGLTGPTYAISAMLLGSAFLVSGVYFLARKSSEAARLHVLASVAYLPLLLAIMMVDKTPVA